jgi:hypothetical protein
MLEPVLMAVVLAADNSWYLTMLQRVVFPPTDISM